MTKKLQKDNVYCNQLDKKRLLQTIKGPQGDKNKGSMSTEGKEMKSKT